MASIQTGIELNDQFTGVVYGIINSVNLAVSSMDDMRQGMGADIDASALEGAREEINRAAAAMRGLGEADDAYSRLSQAAGSTGSRIRDDADAQNAFNREVGECRSQAMKVAEGFSGWQKAIITANQALGLVKGTLGRIGFFDMDGAFGRLDTMKRFEKTITVMTGDAGLAGAALEQLKKTTLGTAYGLDVAAKSTQGFMTRGMALGAAADQVRIWADAVSFYGEGTNEQLEGVTDAIGKMYSKGKVEAMQLDRLFNAGIGAAEIYASAVGQSVASVKEDLGKGTISAAQFLDAVSQALDSGISSGAAKDAGSTWATTFANMRAAMTRGWTDVISDLDEALASHGLPSSMEMVAAFGKKMEGVLEGVGGLMNLVVGAAANAADAMSGICSVVADAWPLISPIVYGVAAALAAYGVQCAIVNGLELAAVAAKGAMAAASGIQAAACMVLSGSTWEAAAAQYGLNGAMYASPIAWVVGLVVALAAVFYAAVAAVNKFAGTSISATGVICGAFMTAAAFIGNLLVALVNFATDLFVTLWNFIAAFADFFGNVFDDPVGSVARLFFDLVDTVLSLLQSLASAVDAIFGSSLADSVQGWRDSLGGWVDSAFGKGVEVMERLDSQDLHLDRFEYGDAWDAGNSFGKGIDEGISNLLHPGGLGGDGLPPLGDYGGGYGLDGIGSGVDDIAGNTGAIKEAMDVTEEDLKYLRDLAEQEAVNRYTVAEINIDQSGMQNTVKNGDDLDGFISSLTDSINEAVDSIAEGTHA